MSWRCARGTDCTNPYGDGKGGHGSFPTYMGPEEVPA